MQMQHQYIHFSLPIEVSNFSLLISDFKAFFFNQRFVLVTSFQIIVRLILLPCLVFQMSLCFFFFNFDFEKIMAFKNGCY